MKLFKFAIVLIPFSTLNASPSVTVQNKAEQKVDTYQSLSEELFNCIYSLNTLTMSITDEESLKKSTDLLTKNHEKVTVLAKKFSALPIPSAEEIEKINEKMEKKAKELNSGNYLKHLSEMPMPLKLKWQKAQSNFYKHLSKHQDTFEKYFEVEKQAEKKK